MGDDALIYDRVLRRAGHAEVDRYTVGRGGIGAWRDHAGLRVSVVVHAYRDGRPVARVMRWREGEGWRVPDDIPMCIEIDVRDLVVTMLRARGICIGDGDVDGDE